MSDPDYFIPETTDEYYEPPRRAPQAPRRFSPDAYYHTTVHDAACFTTLFHPWRHGYNRNVRDSWFRVPELLSLELIQLAIDGKATIGYLSTHRTTVLGIDLDDHDHGGWTPRTRHILPNLHERYTLITSRFPVPPSLVAETPRGIHLFYFLSKPISHQHLHHLTHLRLAPITNTLNTLNTLNSTTPDPLQTFDTLSTEHPDPTDLPPVRQPYELKPTPTTTLRIPRRQWLRNPATLTPLYKHTTRPIDWHTFPIYHLSTLFGPDYRRHLSIHGYPHPTTLNPAALIPGIHPTHPTPPRSTKKRRNTRSTQAPPSPINHTLITDIESQYLPFQPHQTNDQLLQLVPAYLKAGLTPDQAITRIIDHLRSSPTYTGPLTNPDKATRRITHVINYVTNHTHTPSTPNNPIQPTDPIQSIHTTDSIEPTEHLVAKHPFVPQRTKAIRRFLESLASWKTHHDRIYANKALLGHYDDVHPFYQINRSNGFYPLPKNLLRSWNDNYGDILTWLINIHVLTRSPHSYIPGKTCLYYKINLNPPTPIPPV